MHHEGAPAPANEQHGANIAMHDAHERGATAHQASPGDEPSTPAAIVDTYLSLLMIPDPDAARRFVAPDLRIRFTGGREMRDPSECAAFNATRYKWVKKRFERTEVVAGGTDEETVVYNIGTLYGQWPDGTPFEGNRYVDRYVLRGGLIVQMDVWNDSAEWLLSPGTSGAGPEAEAGAGAVAVGEPGAR